LDEIISDHGTGLHLVHMMFRLCEEEGIWDARIPRAYFDAFQIAIVSGDEARAKVFAERIGFGQRTSGQSAGPPQVPVILGALQA
jgi:hypothetical protein